MCPHVYQYFAFTARKCVKPDVTTWGRCSESYVDVFFFLSVGLGIRNVIRSLSKLLCAPDSWFLFFFSCLDASISVGEQPVKLLVLKHSHISFQTLFKLHLQHFLGRGRGFWMTCPSNPPIDLHLHVCTGTGWGWGCSSVVQKAQSRCQTHWNRKAQPGEAAAGSTHSLPVKSVEAVRH